MRDMVPPERRSIRNIPVSATRRRHEIDAPLREEADMDDEMNLPSMQERPLMQKRRAPRSRRWFLIIAAIVVIVCALAGLLLSTLFAGATVTVYPREETVTPPPTVVAKLSPAAGELGYKTMTVTRSASTTVAASGSKQVSRSASGVITVYNAAGPETQRLIANTRFEAPDGKIYRIHESIVVPGTTKASDGTTVPGSATITVYADSPGADYNRGETRFTIPGFKSDPKYDKFYAQTSSIAGGFVGQEPAVAAADLSKAGDTLKQGLSQAAQSSLTSQIPADYIAIPGSLQVTFSDLSQTPAGTDSATISQSATMSGAIVESSALAAAVAQGSVQGYSGEAVAFADLSQITFATATTTRPGDDMTVTLGGTPTLVWQYDPAALKSALVGKAKDTFQAIVESFAPAITRAEAKVRPFWQHTFPADPDKIEVVTGTQK
jgi:hypothetical protein